MGHVPLSGQSQHATRQRAAVLSLVVGVAMVVAKWAAYWLTGSHAILSDAIESFVNVAASAFALLSLILSARPPDPKYPYGYGKIAYFSAGFEGGLIALAACAIFYESAQGLFYGQALRRLDRGLAVLALTGMVNLALGLALLRLGRRTQSIILLADGRHILADVVTSFGVVLGVALVLLTGKGWLDNVVAVLVALNILWTGYTLVRQAVIGLMDRADPQMLGRIVEALERERRPGWIDIHQLRAWQAGDRSFVDFHLVVPEQWTVAQVHDAHLACLEILGRTLGEPTEMIIHFDPARRGLQPDEAMRPWTVASAVRVPGFGELGSEPDLEQVHASATVGDAGRMP